MNFWNGLISKAESWIRLPAAGVDISDISLKYVRPSIHRKITKDDFGEVVVPRGLIESGEIKREKELIEFLQKNFTEKNIKISYIVGSLPEEKSFLRVIQLPRVNKEEIANAIRWELEANVPLPPGDLYFDYEIIKTPEKQTDHLDVLIVSFPKTIIDSYMRTLKSAGFSPVALELESQAIVRSVLPSSASSDEALIIVDIGATRSTVVLFAGRSLILTVTVNFGGDVMHKALAKNLGVSVAEAEKIKKGAGLDRSIQGGKVYDALLLSLNPLVEELKREIIYYQDHISHRHGASDFIDKIYLCGGDANLIGLPAYLAATLDKKVVMADPFINLRNHSDFFMPPLAKNRALAFTTALGLALRAPNNYV